jgi:hypothetical protein
MIRKYFYHYSYSGGQGNGDAYTPKLITVDTIRTWEKQIEKRYNITGVTITNFIQIKNIKEASNEGRDNNNQAGKL